MVDTFFLSLGVLKEGVMALFNFLQASPLKSTRPNWLTGFSCCLKNAVKIIHLLMLVIIWTHQSQWSVQSLPLELSWSVQYLWGRCRVHSVTRILQICALPVHCNGQDKCPLYSCWIWVCCPRTNVASLQVDDSISWIHPCKISKDKTEELPTLPPDRQTLLLTSLC